MIYKHDDQYNESYAPYLLESNIFEEIDLWKTHNQNHLVQKFTSNTISDEDYEMLRNLISTLKTEEKYSEYKKAFAEFCKYCHIDPRGTIIKKYILKKGKNTDKNSLDVDYSYNIKKIQLPEGTQLYHMSRVEGIKKLTPFFRGKAYYRGKTEVNPFLYDKHRIYLTIRRNMPKFLADYKMNEKVNLYLVKENIKEAYVDPLVWGSVYGAVYIERTTPVSVEELTAKKAKEFAVSQKAIKEGSMDFEDFYSFISENGLILCDE